MSARSVVTRCFRLVPRQSYAPKYAVRYLATSNAPPNKNLDDPGPPPKSWLTKQVLASPTAFKVFKAIANVLGYGSPTQVAGRRALVLYQQLCVLRAEEEKDFWLNDCHLPPTFQSWFTITNLHIWLLTVRLRALRSPYGQPAIQGLLDHFFIDVEDRIRYVLQPHPSLPPPANSSFYIPRNNSSDSSQGDKPRKSAKAPERLVTQQMKVFREQWAGMGMALDLGLIKGDMEMAGAVWRNLLGARGAQGIVYPSSSTSSPPTHHFRRSINYVGITDAEMKSLEKKGLENEEARDDGSGIHDFGPEEADAYVKYPEVMADVVAYVRRELTRLEGTSDEQVLDGSLEKLKFGKVRMVGERESL